MSYRISVAALLLFVLALSVAASRQRGKKDVANYHITWEKTLEEGKITARKYLRPIVLHFCPEAPHRLAFNEDASTFDTDEVKKLAPETVFVRVPPGTDTELEEKYKIKEIPTIVVIDEKGVRLSKNIEGHCDWPDLVKEITAAHKKKQPLNAKECELLDGAWERYEEAIKEKEYRKAIFALNTVKKVKQETWFHEEAEKAYVEIDKAADGEIEKAKKLTESDPSKAVKMLKEIEKNFATRPAEEAAEKLRKEIESSKKVKPDKKELAKQTARQLYRDALKLKNEGKIEPACAKLKELITNHPNSPFAAEARRLLREMGRE